MTVQPRPRTQVLAGLFLGVIAVALITALLTAAFSSTSADDKLDKLDTAIVKLDAATQQLDAMRVRQSQLQDQLDAQQRGTMKARQAAVNRDAELRRRLYVLTVFLRRQGYTVPNLAPSPGSEPSNRPKAPRRTSPGSPTPTGPSPRSPGPDPLLMCQLVPALCIPLALPPLLP